MLMLLVQSSLPSALSFCLLSAHCTSSSSFCVLFIPSSPVSSPFLHSPFFCLLCTVWELNPGSCTCQASALWVDRATSSALKPMLLTGFSMSNSMRPYWLLFLLICLNAVQKQLKGVMVCFPHSLRVSPQWLQEHEGAGVEKQRKREAHPRLSSFIAFSTETPVH